MSDIRKIQNQGGQKLVSLPREAREALDIEAGDYVGIDVENGRLVIRPVSINAARNPRTA